MITIADAKKHLRIDHDDDDSIINIYLDAAREQMHVHIGLEIVEVVADPMAQIEDSKMLDAAALLFVGNLYENRESTANSLTELPNGYWSIIQSVRIMGV